MSPTPDIPSNPLAITPYEVAVIRETRGSAAAVVTAARDLSVADAGQAQRAGEILRDLATVRKRANTTRLELAKPHRDHVALINDQYREPGAMLDEADGVIRAKLLAYQREQARLAKVEQDRLDIIAEEQRRADEAERDRAAAEARRQAEAWQAREAELAATAKATNDADIQRAADAAKAAGEALANLGQARAIEPLPVRPVQVVEAPAKTAGVATRKTWTFVVDFPSSVPRRFLMVDRAAINTFMRDEVRAGRTPELPGVRFEQSESLSVRSR